RKHFPQDSVLLFILPPSVKELEKRLRGRGKDSPAELENRLKEASREISEAPRYDYIIHNENFDEAYAQLKAILITERLKSWRLSPLF
ncbi:MAG: guanylate kinase, partial [Bacteriovoracaceae bacterium]|nr:guanylate kinase [Bacteriovoracaceae bacterium]